ncbi:MAG TPA: hypothetical protein EYQ80_07195 [Candidatus Poseidoniales archaeon]|nr:hypothetical protein [Candidatus Poseidoniales archaeon]
MRPLRWLIPLLLTTMLFIGTVVADDDDDDDDDESILGMDGEDLGSVALWLLVATMTIVVWKPGYIWLNKNAKNIFDEPKEVKKKLRRVNTFYMRIHYWIGGAVVVVGGMHGLGTGSEGHPYLFWGGWVGLVLMSISGALMLWKWPPRKVRKGARMLHAQRTLAVVTIVLLVVAHSVAD